jgi:transcriptional regulator with XRE-family HTH domain
VAELASDLGGQVRSARIARNLSQSDLAVLANLSVRAMAKLERGEGSSLSTFLAVVRALGKSEWLETLAPSVTVSPMHLLMSKPQTTRRSRVRSRHVAKA